MSIAALSTRPVVIVRRQRASATDPYGEDTLTEVGREAARVQLHQRGSDEPAEGQQNTVTTRWTLFAPAWLSLGRDDLVEVDGTPYELEGDPYAARHPHGGGRTHHLEVALIQVVG